MARLGFESVCTEMLAVGRTVRFRAPGTSMHPAIRDGETLIVEPLGARPARRGEVLLFRSRRGLTAHRVRALVASAGDVRAIVLRGDNSGAADERVEPRDVLGRVVAVERGGRRIDPGSLLSRGFARLRRLLGSLKRAPGALIRNAAADLHNGLRRHGLARQGGLS